MAANKFATIVHRKTNRFSLLLLYAFLEWTLIFFVLLNSLLSFFILQFSDFFGLKRPCLLCSTLFHSSPISPAYPHLFCHDHSLQLSRIRFCPIHRKFADSGDFCEDCSSSPDFTDEMIESCSCCGASVENRASNPCPMIDLDSGILGLTDDGIPIGQEFPIGVEQIRSDSVCEKDNVESAIPKERSFAREEVTEKNLPSENSDNQTVPQASGEKEEVNHGGDDNDAEEEFSCFISSFDCNEEPTSEKEEENHADSHMEAERSFVELSMDKPDEDAQKHIEFYIDGHDCHLIPVEFFRPGEEVGEISERNGDVILDFGDLAAEKGRFSEEIVEGSSADDLLEMEEEEADAEVSIGTEIPDHYQIDYAPSHEFTPEDDDHEQEEETLEFRTVKLEAKRPLMMGSGNQDSLDSEIESPDPFLTIEKLQSVLREERKALNALYAELEEERNASAVAANETMAMINRLQEEKAAMQMEALQYQRMMEEQSEYDQDALLLMNELLVKREKEKAELEKEIELYRKRVEEYESKEKMGMSRRRASSDDSFKNGDLDEDRGLQLGKDRNFDDSDDTYGGIEMKSTPADAVLCLEECFADLDRERLSILGQLKVLEEKLSTLNEEEDEPEEIFEDVKTFYKGYVREIGHFHTKEINEKHNIIKSKKLLPLFDAADAEMENGLSSTGNPHENGVDGSENGGISIEEEIDELYDRLEALEADREFMRHCVGSLRKGDKGVYLLQQILQNLRDLRNVELQVQNYGDMALCMSSS
ncbi:PREDICTED: myosin-binding protein 2-like [Tarenaya hassleriana]|uniref:myosin-binding protein 2-like n=1 Tax=Tarenaya hassleriana TaxID=28532 RepID=UPI00053C2163|nr:PREDICTED: myosin-binding protein 2-like [Tarenaya hassleriana]